MTMDDIASSNHTPWFPIVAICIYYYYELITTIMEKDHGKNHIGK